MRDDVIDRWANLLVDYCLEVRPDQKVLIGADIEARPLVEACYRAIVDRQADPIVRLELPGLHEYYLARATERLNTALCWCTTTTSVRSCPISITATAPSVRA